MNSSSQIEPSAILVESVESSVENLLKRWRRRERWRVFFSDWGGAGEPGGRDPWRIKLAHFLEGPSARFITLGLLVADLVLTVFELSSASLVSCSSRRKQESISRGSPSYWAGVAILGLLLARILALIVALGCGAFLRQPGCVVDGAVVAAALSLEAFVGRAGGGLVAVASLWRVVRVVESAFELSDEAIELQIEDVKRQLDAVREENRRVWERVREDEEEIARLKEELDRCCPRETSTLSLNGRTVPTT